MPVRTSYAPLSTCTSPCPPESTTPASFSTGSISGVFASTASASSITRRANSSTSSTLSESSAALSAAPFATVRIVPSFGFITALYAVSTAFCIAPARSITSSSSWSRMPLVNPLKSWDRITPELPLAPLKEPEEMHFPRVYISGLSSLLTSAAAAVIVIVILVPVSPSGTGNTFSSLIHSLLDSRFFAPPRNIFATIWASIVLIKVKLLPR